MKEKNKRIVSKNDTTSIALLLTSKKLGIEKLDLKTIDNYDEIVNKNIEASNILGNIYYSNNIIPPIFDYISDENKRTYVHINKNININEAFSYYFNIIPLGIIIAAEQNNALNVLGLEYDYNEKIIKAKTKTLKL